METELRPRLYVRLDDNRALVCVKFSSHALEEYIQRAKPALSRDEAVLELQALVGIGALRKARPEWLRCRQFAAMYLDLGDIVFPVDPDKWNSDPSALVAVTCLVRGHAYHREPQ